MQVRQRNRVVVEDAEGSDARAGQILQRGRAKAACAHNEDARALEFVLSRPADAPQDDLAGIAFDFFAREAHPHSTITSGAVARRITRVAPPLRAAPKARKRRQPKACQGNSRTMDLLNTVVLGLIEGITEFLPISSTGHLLIAEHWLGERSETFNVVIQAGAILAVTLIYWRRLVELVVDWRNPDNSSYGFKLIVAFLITAVLGFLAKRLGFVLPDTLAPVAWALIIGGVWILAVEWYVAKKAEIPYVSWLTSIVVGVAQIVAGIFPGTSRSGASIFAAMLTGTTDRRAATEFAFLVGIPTMYAASGYELFKSLKESGVQQEDWTAIGIAFVVSTVTAFIAVKWLLGYIQTHRFTAFAIYRIILGAAILAAVGTGRLT